MSCLSQRRRHEQCRRFEMQCKDGSQSVAALAFDVRTAGQSNIDRYPGFFAASCHR